MSKRMFDVIVAGMLLLITSPVLVMVACLIRLKLGSPVIFSQVRPGRHGKAFKMFKFRTMLSTKDLDGELLSDEQRMTRFGRILRALSIDELPELWNVLKGDMSLVGPRPLLMEYLPRYTPEQMRRHEVTPGITGWAQVNGRNALSWEDKFRLDVWYVTHRSFWLDMKILCLTAKKVLIRQGINAPGQATAERFMGSG